MFELKAFLSLHADGRRVGGVDRIELLARIGETGSISAAARAVGMSYKGAWDAIDAMNNLADEPLVQKVAGGKSGGGSVLTPRAERLIAVFRSLEIEHRRFVQQLGGLGDTSLEDIQLMRRFMIRTSARNQFAGKVVSVEAGAVNDVVVLQIAGDQRIVATVTRESGRELGLAPGREVTALIKASSVLVGLPHDNMRLSARNQLAGSISRVTPGAVNAEISIELPGGGVVVAIITNTSAEMLGLAEGLPVLAIIQASSVLLGTLD